MTPTTLSATLSATPPTTNGDTTDDHHPPRQAPRRAFQKRTAKESDTHPDFGGEVARRSRADRLRTPLRPQAAGTARSPGGSPGFILRATKVMADCEWTPKGRAKAIKSQRDRDQSATWRGSAASSPRSPGRFQSPPSARRTRVGAGRSGRAWRARSERQAGTRASVAVLVVLGELVADHTFDGRLLDQRVAQAAEEGQPIHEPQREARAPVRANPAGTAARRGSGPWPLQPREVDNCLSTTAGALV
jgi:hypothetical protein